MCAGCRKAGWQVVGFDDLSSRRRRIHRWLLSRLSQLAPPLLPQRGDTGCLPRTTEEAPGYVLQETDSVESLGFDAGSEKAFSSWILLEYWVMVCTQTFLQQSYGSNSTQRDKCICNS